MGELRKDPILGRWVIVKTEGSLMPEDYEKEIKTFHQQAICPFCPDREDRTPPEIEAVRDGGEANSSNWRVRVVPNKFPAFDISGEIDRRGVGVFDMSNGIGAHEVVIETRDHCKDIPDLTDQEVFDIISKYCSRSIDLAKDPRFKYVLVFKNYGAEAGASLEHAHSQVMALPMVPKYVLEALKGSDQYYRFHGRCIYCDIIHQEMKDKERIITENEDFICFAPYASRFSFESWVMPKEHQVRFCEMSDDQKYNLGKILKEILIRNKVCLSDPSYNFFVHTAPVKYHYPEGYHWHIEVIPKLTNMAGFEWGTGFYVVQTDPLIAAKLLRETPVG